MPYPSWFNPENYPEMVIDSKFDKLSLWLGVELISTIERLKQEADEMESAIFYYIKKVNAGQCVLITGNWRGQRFSAEITADEMCGQVIFHLMQIKGYRNGPISNVDQFLEVLRTLNPGHFPEKDSLENLAQQENSRNFATT